MFKNTLSFNTRSNLASVGFDWCVETGKKKYAEKQDPERWVESEIWGGGTERWEEQNCGWQS